MKHLLILLSFLFLSSHLLGHSKKGDTLYRWGEYPDYKWLEFDEKETHPKYQGRVKDGKPNGLGIFIFPDGSNYVGSWKDGKRNGQGTYTYHSGDKYVGSWKNGKRNGQGTETFNDGRKYEGDYKDGKQWNGIFYENNGNIFGKWANGAYLEP